MTKNLLSTALADVLCESPFEGMVAAYLPKGVPAAVGEGIVREANFNHRAGEEPFAVLVTSSPTNDPDPDCFRVLPNDLIKYRFGRRLAVVTGSPELASINSSFREVLSQSFPEGEANRPFLRRLASALVRAVLREASVPTHSTVDLTDAATRMYECLLQLMSMHLAIGEDAKGWNARWFEHVRIGARALANMFRYLAAHSPSMQIEAVFLTYTFPSFGLPIPADGLHLRGGHPTAGKEAVQALRDWWSDHDRILGSISLLEKSSGIESPHPLSLIDWGDFDQVLSATDNLAETWTRTISGSAEHVVQFAELAERDFFSPISVTDSMKELVAFDVDMKSMSFGPSDGSQPFIARAHALEATWQTETLCWVIPTSRRPPIEAVESTSATISLTTTAAIWQGDLRVSAAGELTATGRFMGRRAWGLNKGSLWTDVFVDAKSDDSLAGWLLPTARAQVLIAAPESVGLTVLKLNSKGHATKAHKTVESYPDAEEAGESEAWSIDLDSATSVHRILCWGNPLSKMTHEGRPLRMLDGRPDLRITDITPQGIDEFEVDDEIFRLIAPSEARPHYSPLIAAISKQSPSTEELPMVQSQSLRARYEAAFVSNAGDEAWLKSLGHVVLATSEGGSIESVRMHRGFLLPTEMRTAWDDALGLAVPPELTDSAAADRFRMAFQDLDALGIVSEPDLPSQARWPSRVPRRHLWDERPDTLTEYLDSYTDLVAHAEALGDPFGIFWATFPFSISAWPIEPDSQGCASVLLSPLHPLRLAWLAAAEATLWSADRADQLAGAVQGFGFPFSGPSENSTNGMLAVPSDAGYRQIFLGWEMLVASSITGHRSLTTPPRIGSTTAPGSAASGLNAAAVGAAMKNYRRMHPHVSTLTIDISSQSPAPRLVEIDHAVGATLSNWEKRPGERLLGGARVLDSSNRGGPAPTDEITELVRNNPGLPMSWSHYTPVAGKAPVCNIRLLQDSGVKVKVRDSKGAGHGVVGSIPLRRFDATLPEIKPGRAAVIRPGLPTAALWGPFQRALQMVEKSPEVESKLFGSLLIDVNADWTVSGESLLSPNAIAAMLATDAKNRMLWEWRPPVFEKAADMPLLDRKAYVTVARIPLSFRHQIQKMLGRSIGRDASDDEVDTLLSTLGSRGVGLSSLLAIGGTQAIGALGFFLGFSLIDAAASVKVRSETRTIRLVLPIDAADSFLLALAGEAKTSETRKRADLLVVEVSDSEVTFAPIEIKFYGLEAETSSGSLPAPGSAAFGDPLQQLESTVALLNKAVGQFDSAASEGRTADLALWSNGLAALLEAGARLTPLAADNSELWRDLLTKVADGKLRVRVGHPLVNYFVHEPRLVDDHDFGVFSGESAGDSSTLEDFGALVSDSARAFSSLHGESMDLLRKYRSLLDWALATPPDQNVTVDREENPGSLPIQTSATQLHEAPPQTSLRGQPARDPLPSGGPHEGDGVKFPVGHILGSVRSEPAYFWPGNTRLNQMNVGVVGDLGTGKTELLKTLVYQIRNGAGRTQDNPLSLLVFDYKGDFQEPMFLNAVGGAVLPPQRIPLNFFALAGEFTAHKAVQRATMFGDVIGKIYGGVGPIQHQNLVKAIVNGFSNPRHDPPTLAEVLTAYEATAGKPDAVSSILTSFVMSEIFSDDRSSLLPFEELIEDRVLVLALDALGVDQKGKNALVVLFLNMYYEYMLNSRKWPFSGSEPQIRRLNSFLLVDEATNIMNYDFPVLMQLMLQGRQFGFGTILASQYLSHFRTSKSNYGQPLLTWFIHKVPDVTLKELTNLGIKGLPERIVDQIGQLSLHEALYSSLGYEGMIIRDKPFYQLAAEEDLWDPENDDIDNQ